MGCKQGRDGFYKFVPGIGTGRVQVGKYYSGRVWKLQNPPRTRPMTIPKGGSGNPPFRWISGGISNLKCNNWIGPDNLNSKKGISNYCGKSESDPT